MSKMKYFGSLAAVVTALTLVSARPAQADTIYNATGGAENGGDPLNAATGAGPILADRFISATNATLNSVTLNLSLSPGSMAAQNFSVDLFADAGATGPGALLSQIAVVMDTSLTSGFSLLTFQPTTAVLLSGGQSYYIGVMDNGSNAVLGNSIDPAVLSRPSVAAGASYYNNGGVQANAGGPYEISVDASPVPEPSSWVLLLTGAAALGMFYRKSTNSQTRIQVQA